MNRTHKRVALALLVIVLAGGLAPAVEAGCVVQYNDCADCAQKLLRHGVYTLSPSRIRQANLELLDCSIDLYHCVFYAQHHEYQCDR